MLSASESTGSAERFAVARRGYDAEQVDKYLDGLEAQVKSQLDASAARIKQLEGELADARRNEEAVTLTMVAATKAKEQMLESAQRQLDDATSSAQKKADKLLSEAQYEAYRLVSEAKETSEAALAEARAEAESTLTSARRESVAILNQIKEEGSKLREAHESDLEAMKRRFEEENAELTERITMLRTVAGDLEKRLQAVARGALEDLSDIVGQGPAVPARQARAASATPPADAPRQATAETVEPSPEGEREPRGSFYSRRSAKLPHIGENAGKDALAAVSAMRARAQAEHQGTESANALSERELAVQPASA